MKKTDKRWTIRLGALSLSAVLLGTGAALATGGDQSDPLVTLSYLNQTAIPQIVRQVEDKTAARQKELERALADQISQYKQQAEQNTPSGGSASYTLVSMNQGQVMSLGVGCELLLRVGRLVLRGDGGQRRIPDQEPSVHGHHCRPHPHRLHRREAAGAGKLLYCVKLSSARDALWGVSGA